MPLIQFDAKHRIASVQLDEYPDGPVTLSVTFNHTAPSPSIIQTATARVEDIMLEIFPAKVETHRDDTGRKVKTVTVPSSAMAREMLTDMVDALFFNTEQTGALKKAGFLEPDYVAHTAQQKL